MAQLIDGKKISKQIKDELKEEVQRLGEIGKNACLAVVQVGNDPASSVYVNNKKKACAYIGIGSKSYELPEATTEEELVALVEDLNADETVNGILVQLPLPAHIDADRIIRTISPDKDVDGFHPVSVGRLWIGEKGFLSCTPAGIIQLLKRSGIAIEGKECVVIGRSNIVGKPPGERDCNGRAFQDERSEGSGKARGHPDRSDRKEEVYYGRICKRRCSGH